MADEKTAAQKAKAARLHRQIDAIKGGRVADQPAAADAPRPKSAPNPRDFIHKKMRELDRKETTECGESAEDEPPGKSS